MRADGKNLSLSFGTTEVACVSSSVVLDAEKADADKVTFFDVINGLDWQWYFAITAFPDYALGTWWDFLWTQPAFTPITYVFKPCGNGVASTTQPWFTGSVTVDRKPPLGGQAGQVWQFDARLSCTAIPIKKTS